MKAYYEALERLKKGCPVVVPKGTKITNDSVSLEAGRQKGSIKKSRPQFADLIEAVSAAAAVQSRPERNQEIRIARDKHRAVALQAQLDAALAREQSLVLELFELRKEMAKLTGAKLYPIRRR